MRHDIMSLGPARRVAAVLRICLGLSAAGAGGLEPARASRESDHHLARRGSAVHGAVARRRAAIWIWIVAMQVARRAAPSARSIPIISRFADYAPYALANSLDGIVGASIATRIMVDPQIPRLRNVLLFIAAVAIGAAASAVLGAFGDSAARWAAPTTWRELAAVVGGELAGITVHCAGVDGLDLRFRAREFSAPAAPHGGADVAWRPLLWP